MLFAFDFVGGELVLVLISAIIAFAIIIFLTVLAVMIISERIILMRLKRDGFEKEVRTEVFKRLRSWQKIIRKNKKQEKHKH